LVVMLQLITKNASVATFVAMYAQPATFRWDLVSKK